MGRALSSGYDDGSNTDASRVVLNTDEFSGLLSDIDDNVQKALETLDKFIAVDGITITGSGVSGDPLVAALPNQRAFSFTIDGGGIVPSTSEIGTAVAGCAGTITGWRAQEVSTEAGVSSSASWVVKKNGTAISGTEKPSLSSQTDNSDTTLTTWTTGFSKGDRFDLVPESYTAGKKFLVTIYYTASS